VPRRIVFLDEIPKGATGKLQRIGLAAKLGLPECNPNCETEEDDEEPRVFVIATRDINPGEELNYDYGLVIDERMTPTLKKNYECRCGSKNCRGTMLALKSKPAKSTKRAPAKRKTASKKA
jgi:uncharacterized protein